MKLILALLIVIFAVVFVAAPILDMGVNKARSSAAYAEQRKLQAQAELERAKAATVTAKGEADALRMAINQPIALLAIPVSLLAVVSVTVLVMAFIRQQQRMWRDQRQHEWQQQSRTITVFANGNFETLYVAPGQDAELVARRYLAALPSRSLTVWVDDTQ